MGDTRIGLAPAHPGPPFALVLNELLARSPCYRRVMEQALRIHPGTPPAELLVGLLAEQIDELGQGGADQPQAESRASMLDDTVVARRGGSIARPRDFFPVHPHERTMLAVFDAAASAVVGTGRSCDVELLTEGRDIPDEATWPLVVIGRGTAMAWWNTLTGKIEVDRTVWEADESVEHVPLCWSRGGPATLETSNPADAAVRLLSLDLEVEAHHVLLIEAEVEADLEDQ